MNKLIKEKLISVLQGKKILILGFGREGRSSYNFLRKAFPKRHFTIADKNPKAFANITDDNLSFVSGNDYLEAISHADWVMKSPGISFKNISIPHEVIISSQTDLFLYLVGNQIIGVTGTKGKSTTASLIFHILSNNHYETKLVGNIGIPALEIMDSVENDTSIIYELSSHQLQYSRFAPHMAVLLNLFEEHLDHYKDYASYRHAKWQISAHQNKTDFFLFNADDPMTQADLKMKFHSLAAQQIPVSYLGNSKAKIYFDGKDIFMDNNPLGFDIAKFKLVGRHNVFNLMVALEVAVLKGISPQAALSSAYDFKGLPHRLEFLGNFKGIEFVNDSIATIPQATINAIEAVENVQTLILGGFDRKISYRSLIDYLMNFNPLNIILLGEVGVRIEQSLLQNNYQGKLHYKDCFDDAVKLAFKLTESGKTCLLSPAAASYDKFKNFEERGNRFRQMVLQFAED